MFYVIDDLTIVNAKLKVFFINRRVAAVDEENFYSY
jgi:hypothetical protein